MYYLHETSCAFEVEPLQERSNQVTQVQKLLFGSDYRSQLLTNKPGNKFCC